MKYASIDDLRANLGKPVGAQTSADYAAKMLHPLPETKVVADRNAFVLEHVKGKRVLEFGASGTLNVLIALAASVYVGVDREDRAIEVEREGQSTLRFDVTGFDLDDVQQVELPAGVFGEIGQDAPDVIICGEVLEHLSNPGWFLTRVRQFFPGVPVLITVPNAFSDIGRKWLARGIENVNVDHVAWYSPKTLSVLLMRAGFSVADLYYYNGTGPTAEGLIVVTE